MSSSFSWSDLTNFASGAVHDYYASKQAEAAASNAAAQPRPYESYTAPPGGNGTLVNNATQSSVGGKGMPTWALYAGGGLLLAVVLFVALK